MNSTLSSNPVYLAHRKPIDRVQGGKNDVTHTHKEKRDQKNPPTREKFQPIKESAIKRISPLEKNFKCLLRLFH